MTQPSLFNPDVVPLRSVVYATRLTAAHVAQKNLPCTRGLLHNVQILTQALDAVLSGDAIALRLAGISPDVALELAGRLTSAARAIRRV